MLVMSLGLLIQGIAAGEEELLMLERQHCVCDCIWRRASHSVRSFDGQVHSCLQVHFRLVAHYYTSRCISTLSYSNILKVSLTFFVLVIF